MKKTSYVQFMCVAICSFISGQHSLMDRGKALSVLYCVILIIFGVVLPIVETLKSTWGTSYRYVVRFISKSLHWLLNKNDNVDNKKSAKDHSHDTFPMVL